MSRVGRAVRVTALVAVAAGIAVGAARVPGTIELAPPRDQAGLPQVSRVLVDEAVLGVPRAAATRRPPGCATSAATCASPRRRLRPPPCAPPVSRLRPEPGQVDLESGVPGAVVATGATVDGLVAAAVTTTRRSSRGRREHWLPDSWPPRSGDTPATTTEDSS